MTAVGAVGGSGAARERRANALLRLLVDEMMEQVRELHRHAGPWPEGERAEAESALERIMTRVREEALHPQLPPSG